MLYEVKGVLTIEFYDDHTCTCGETDVNVGTRIETETEEAAKHIASKNRAAMWLDYHKDVEVDYMSWRECEVTEVGEDVLMREYNAPMLPMLQL